MTSGGTEYPSQATWTRTPDSLYLQPMHDGSLVCFRAGQPGVHWSIDFETPVVSIFDVVLPPPAVPGEAQQHPIMFEQPHPLLVPDLPLDFALLQQEPATTFVGRIGPAQREGETPSTEAGELFAMSRDRFPLVPFAQMASGPEGSTGLGEAETGGEEDVAEKEEEGEGGVQWTKAPVPCRGLDCIIGRHRLRNPPPPSPIHLDSTLDAPSSEPLLIDPPNPSPDPSPSSPHHLPAGTPNRSSPPYPGSSTLLANIYKSTARELKGLGKGDASGGRYTLGILALILGAWLWKKAKKSAGGQGGKVRLPAKVEDGERRSRRSSDESIVDEELPQTPADEAELQFLTETTPKQRASTKAPVSKAGMAKGKVASPLANLTNGGLRRRSPSTPPTPTSLSFTAASSPLNDFSTSSSASSSGRARSSSLSLAPALPIVSHLKALPPLPPSASDGQISDADPSSSVDPSVTSSPPVTSAAIDEDVNSDGNTPAGATPPRKRNRRRRGAKKKKGGAKEASSTSLDEEFSVGLDGSGAGDKDATLDGITLSERDTRDDDDSNSSPSPASTPFGNVQVDGDGGDWVAAATLGSGLVLGEVVKVRPDTQLGGGLSVSEAILGSLSSYPPLSEPLLMTFPAGYGSHGTIVLRGKFQGRAVAVKRLLKDFVTIAAHEVNLLQESDDHPHVIRYFCKEQRDTFLYIALELCPASLFDLVDQPSSHPDLVAQLDPKKALKQITSGLRHLHSLKIVHRDIKPQNILVSTAKRGRGQGGLRMLISDFGLCKKLDVDESSFQQTVNHAAGSFGYRAPEVLRGLVDPNEAATGSAATPSASIGSGGGSTNTLAGSSGSGGSTDPSMRLTRSIDVFSLGCIFYYVLTRGEHPFGGRYEREMNILQGKVCLDRLDGLGEEAVEVQDLILRMVATNPRERYVPRFSLPTLLLVLMALLPQTCRRRRPPPPLLLERPKASPLHLRRLRPLRDHGTRPSFSNSRHSRTERPLHRWRRLVESAGPDPSRQSWQVQEVRRREREGSAEGVEEQGALSRLLFHLFEKY